MVSKVMKPCQTLEKESTQERERKGKKGKKGQGSKLRQSKSPTKAGHKEERELL